MKQIMILKTGVLIKTKLLILTLMIVFCAEAIGQKVTVNGKVTDAIDHSPLVGATVIVKGTSIGTVTDIDGKFTLVDVGAYQMIEVSFVGYIPKEVSASAGLIEITLEQEIERVDEVVVTALGIEREAKALGYAVQAVDGEEISQVKDPNLLNNLTGKVAGVNIVQGNSGVGSSAKMVIRGESSLSGDNQPLFIVDGVPINNYTNPSITNSSSAGAQEVDYGNGAGEINPDDIESISILKGASAAALYGSRAGNGVVLITTKSGKGQKGIGVEFNHSTTFDQVLVIPSWQDQFGQGSVGEWEYADGKGGGINDSEDLSWGPSLGIGNAYAQFDGPSQGIVNGELVTVRGGDVIARDPDGDGTMNYPITPTEWNAREDNVKDFFDTGLTMSNTIAVRGSNEDGQFRLAYTNLFSNGVIPNNDLDRNTVTLNAGYNLTKKLKANATVSYIENKVSNRPGMGYGSENPMYVFAWYGRQLDTKAMKDYWQVNQEDVAQYNYNYAWHDNPYINAFENTNSSDKNRVLGNVSLTYNITNELNVMIRSGVDNFYDRRVSKRVFSTQRFPKGMYRLDQVWFTEQNSDFLINYNKLLSQDFGISVSFGGNRMEQKNNFNSQLSNELSIPGVYSLNNSAVPLEITQLDYQKRINSLYGLLQLSFKEMIYLDITGRNDWSSTLPNEHNSYFYPSVSLSGVLSEMVELPGIFNFTKIRVSYAEVGNDTDPYRLSGVYENTTPYNSVPAVTEQSTLPNSNLKPERQKSFEVGLDLRMFDNRFIVDLSYYNTVSENQIIGLPISRSSGYGDRFINAGKIRNSGIELVLNLTPVRTTTGFSWDIGLNFFKNYSKVLEISEGLEEYIYASTTVYSNQNAQVFAIAKKDEPLGNIYGTGFEMIDGRVLYEDGLPVPSSELRLLGNYTPDFTMGISNIFRFKGAYLSVLFDYRQGGVVVSRMYSIASTSGTLDHTAEGRTIENPVGQRIGDGVRWDEASQSYVENDVAVSVQTFCNKYYKRDHEESSLFDATFVKLREVKLGYTIPNSSLGNFPIQNISVALVGRNLALWTNQKYFDPETLTYEGASAVPGVEEMAYPSTRSIGFNLSFNF